MYKVTLTCQEWATASCGKSEALDMGGTHPGSLQQDGAGEHVTCHMLCVALLGKSRLGNSWHLTGH